MKKIWLVMIALLPMLWSAPAGALEWECPKMKGFVDAMFAASEYLKENPNFDQNPAMEKDMGVVLKALGVVAKDEGDTDFSNALSQAMRIWDKDSWTSKDSADFRVAFDSTSMNLERIYEKYCD